MAVNRCMCTGTTFAQVKRCAQDTGATYEEILETTRCGEGCGLCLPYIKLVLLTGLVDLPVLTPEVYRRLIAQYSEAPWTPVPGCSTPSNGAEANQPAANTASA